MAFALSGNTITQSGTDTPATVISGLQAIAGVTSVSYSTYTRIYIPYKLNITGSMTTDSTVGLSMTRGGTFANEITIGSGASWTAKEVRNLNGYNYYYQLPSLDFNNAALAGSIWSGSSGNAIIVNGGTLDLANITVNGNGGNWWNGGTIRFRDVTYNAQGLSSVADTQFTTQSGTPTLDIIGWKVIGGKIFLGTANITNFKGVQPVFMQRGFGTSVNSFVLQDFVGGSGNYGDLSAYANPNYEARNLGIGTSTTYFPWISGEANSRGTIQATSDIDLVVTNNAGSSVSSFISYLKDNATGAPTGFTANNYYINTATSGTLSQKILIGVLVASAGAAASFVKRSATQADDLYAFTIFDYNHNILSTQAFNLAGAGVKTNSAIALVDSNVTLTRANAIAKLASSFTINTSTNTITVTANSTLDDLYDAMKAYKCTATQANLEYPTISTQPVTASGTAVVTALNVVVNSGVTLSSGTKFKSLTTSGTFTSAGIIATSVVGSVTTTGTFASGASVIGNVTQATPTNLSGVTIDGNLTYNTNTPITVTFTDCNVTGTVSNSGSGLVTITKVNTTLGTVGSNVSAQQFANISAPNLLSGSRVRLYNVTDSVEIYNAVLSSAGFSYNFSWTANKTIKLIATYQNGTTAKLAVEATGVVTINGLQFLDSQKDDVIYNGYAIDGSTVTKFEADYANDQIDLKIGTNFFVAELYAWWIYNLTTTNGIRDFVGGITAEDAANLRINANFVSIKLDNITSTIVRQLDNIRIYRSDSAYPVVQPTSGGGGMDVNWQEKVYIATLDSNAIAAILRNTNLIPGLL